MTWTRILLVSMLASALAAVSCSGRDHQARQPGDGSPADVPTAAAITPHPISQKWIDADEAVVRLPPDAFPQLPEAVRLALGARACTVPQTRARATPHNVTVGHLLGPNTTDWAVLCSIRRASRVLIFPGGQAESVMEWDASDDVGWLQDLGHSVIGYSRSISTVTPRLIRSHAKGELQTPLDHDGLEEAFLEKASIIHFWNNRRWLTLPRAD